MVTKPFRTINQQIALLESRGLSVGETGYDILLSENYYSVINGYGEPFLDRERSRNLKIDIYKTDTSIEDIYMLFCFDRELRALCLSYLLRTEAHVRSILAYTFCEIHPKTMAYLDKNNYTTLDEYMLDSKYYETDLNKLISELERKARFEQPCKPFISHYRELYGEVPLWVLVNDLTFGNIAHFFNLLPRSPQNTICKRIVELFYPKSNNPLTPYKMRQILRRLVEFRNICAHDDRLYCAKVGKVKDISFFDMLDALNMLLSQADAAELKVYICDLVKKYINRSKQVALVLNDMGFIKGCDS